jgi:hypothetical protein
MLIRPHETQVVVNFPDVGLVDSWSPEQLRPLFSHRPPPVNTHQLEVDQTYMERILDFLKVRDTLHCEASRHVIAWRLINVGRRWLSVRN